ncbi:MAG: helix-turn-helix transcriptional regulator [Euryarchaeota archaeon]|nr:helix-turn-helix transcriptional regulator [Euryarchaeota archaeon]
MVKVELITSQPKNDACPVTETIKIIGKKWYLIILHELTKGGKGFNELKRSVQGISAKVLSESLSDLETKELVVRTVHSESPIRVEYNLTVKGQELEQLFHAMRSWGEKWDVCGEKAPNARVLEAPLTRLR